MLTRINLIFLALLLAAVTGFVSCRKASDEEKEKSSDTSSQTAEAEKAEPPADDSAADTTSGPSAGDPELDAILTKYYEAIGGPEHWSDIKTMKYTGKMQSMGKMFTTAIVYKRPNKCRIDFSLGHIYFIQSYDGKEAWKFNPTAQGSEPAVLEGEDANDIKETCDFDGPLIDYHEKGHKIRYLGKEKIEGKEGHKIEVTFNTGSVDTYYLDTKTYLPFLVKGKAKLNDKEVDSLTTIENYIDTGGVLLPYYFEFDLDGTDENEVLKINMVEINPELEDSVFTFPRRIEDSY